MRKIIAILIIMLLSLASVAQPDCRSKSQSQRTKGEFLFRKGEYKEAIKLFKAASSCPAISRTEQEKLSVLVKKCTEALVAHRYSDTLSESDQTVTTVAVVKQQVEFLYVDYLKSICDGKTRGAELSVVLLVQNYKGSRLRLVCKMAPKNGSGKINESYSSAAEYTIDGGMSGQEQEFFVDDDELYLPVTIFVPYGVMDFAGDYSPQAVKADLFVYMNGGESYVTEFHRMYDDISPHTITVGGRSDEYDLIVEYNGGLLDIMPAVCYGNDVVWSNFPSWINSDLYGIHITENTTSETRYATLKVTSTEGGNVVNVNITQKYRAEGQLSSGKVNDVWMEENLIEDNQGVKKVRFHVDCEVTGARGKEVSLYILFYNPDGITPLLNADGKNVMCSSMSKAPYTDTRWDDFPITTSYKCFTDAQNNSVHEAKYYVCLSEDGGKTWIVKSGPYIIRW